MTEEVTSWPSAVSDIFFSITRTRGLNATVGYSFTQAKNNLKSTEIASVLWQSQPVQGDPNNPELSYSEFGQRHRIVGGATFVKPWSPSLRTSIGLFVEVGPGKVLSGLVRQTAGGARAANVEDVASLTAALAAVTEGNESGQAAAGD